MAQPVYHPPRQDNQGLQNLGAAMSIIGSYFNIDNAYNQGKLIKQQVQDQEAIQGGKTPTTVDFKNKVEMDALRGRLELQDKFNKIQNSRDALKTISNDAKDITKDFSDKEQLFSTLNNYQKQWENGQNLNGNQRLQALKIVQQLGEVRQSAIRESDIALMNSAKSYVDQIKGKFGAALKGENIDDNQLAQLFKVGNDLKAPVNHQYYDRLDFLKGQSQLYGIENQLPLMIGRSNMDILQGKRIFGEFNEKNYPSQMQRSPQSTGVSKPDMIDEVFGQSLKSRGP